PGSGRSDRARRRASSTGSPTAVSSTCRRRPRPLPRPDVSYPWQQFPDRMAMIPRGDPYPLGLMWVTIKVAIVSTAAALVIGLPLGLALGLGRFRGRRAAHAFANAGLALPPVAVGIFVLILLLPRGAFGSLRIEFTLTAVYIVQ